MENLEYLLPQEHNLHTVLNGLARKGEKHSNAKLTNEQVLEIRRLWDEGARPIDLAQQFGIADNTVNYIIHRKTWIHI